MADKKAAAHPDYAERIVKALPAKVREAAEVVAGGGAYSILKVHGRSVASVRDKNVRIVHPTDGSADSLKALAALIAEAAPEAKPEPKPKAAKKPPRPKARSRAPRPNGRQRPRSKRSGRPRARTVKTAAPSEPSRGGQGRRRVAAAALVVQARQGPLSRLRTVARETRSRARDGRSVFPPMPRRGRVVTAWGSAGEEDHPLRIAVLEALDWIGEPCSSIQLAHCLEAHPATVSYHVRVLAGAGYRIELIGA